MDIQSKLHDIQSKWNTNVTIQVQSYGRVFVSSHLLDEEDTVCVYRGEYESTEDMIVRGLVKLEQMHEGLGDRPALPLNAAMDVMTNYNLDQVIILARDHGGPTTHIVTYGKTKQDKDMAAVDGEKVRRMLDGSPTSLEDAIALADSVRDMVKKKGGKAGND